MRDNPALVWAGTTSNSLSDVSQIVVNYIPSILGAFLVIVVGLFVASMISRLVDKMIEATRVDAAFQKLPLWNRLKEVGLGITVSNLLSGFVRWFLVLVFVMAAADILGLTRVSDFLNTILGYIPQVVVASIILTITFLVAGLVYNLVRGSTRAAGVMSAGVLAMVSKWAIIVFGFLAALSQLGVMKDMVDTLFLGVVAALALGFGLAFGLGGKDEAAILLKKFREDVSRKK